MSDPREDQGRGAPSGPVGNTTAGGPLFTDAFGARRAPTPWQLVESYKSLLYACVQINANAVSQVPLRLYADGARGDEPRGLSGPRPVTRAAHARLRTLGYVRSVGPLRDVKEITDHPFLDCLDTPDPGGYFDRQGLLDLVVRYCDVVGTAYVLLDGPQRGVPRWLWPLASQHVTVDPEPETPLIRGYRHFEDYYPFDRVLRFRCTPSLRDPYKAAFSPSYAATDYAGLEDAWVAIQTSLLGNGPRLAMIASAKDPAMAPGDAERRRFAQDLEANHSRGNAGRVLVTNGAYDFTPWNQTPADLAGLEVSRYDLERTANVFGIPLPFLSGETNLANLQAAREQHAKNAVEPRCKLIASVLTRFVRRFDPRLFFAFDSAVPEDEERRARIAQMRLTTGQTTINEENDELQWEPKPWGDEPWLAGTLKQPTMLTESHDQGLEQARVGMDVMKADAEAVAEEEEWVEEEEGEDEGFGDESAERSADAVIEALERLADELTRSGAAGGLGASRSMLAGALDSLEGRAAAYNPYRRPDGKFAPGPRKKRKRKRRRKAKAKAGAKDGGRLQSQVHDAHGPLRPPPKDEPARPARRPGAEKPGPAQSPAGPAKQRPPKDEPPGPPRPSWRREQGPILPDRPIAERIAAAGHLDEKVARLAGSQGKYQDEMDDAIGKEAYAKYQIRQVMGELPADLSKATQDQKRRLIELTREHREAVRRKDEVWDKRSRDAADVLALDADAPAMRWAHKDVSRMTEDAGRARERALAWLDGKVAGDGKDFRVKWEVLSGKDQRASVDPNKSVVRLETTPTAATAVHEMGHVLEIRDEGIRKAAREFFEHRTAGEKPKHLSVLMGSRAYGDHEKAYEDDFKKAFGAGGAYAGKIYREGWTEIVSMGVEKMYKDPAGFAKGDPQYAKFILGILDGSLRKP